MRTVRHAAVVLVCGGVVFCFDRSGAWAGGRNCPPAASVARATAARAVAVPAPLIAPVDLTADCLAGLVRGAVVTNGTVEVGVNCEGHLNVPYPGDPLEIEFLGLRYVPTGAASTEPGCLCEGWGVANGARSGPRTSTCAPGTEQGYANIAIDDGVVNVVLERFLASADSALSTVRVNDGRDLWRVTHDYHPTPLTSNLYEVTVTIENLSGAAMPTLYRRVMDWDIYPTPFEEFVTLHPGVSSPTAKLYRMDNNGFNSANPCSFAPFGTTLQPGDPPAIDVGPDDHGALFDFDFGTLAALGAGASVTFRTYYGAASTEAEALLDVTLVAAENYSFGQPNVDNGDPTHGTPNTFIFAFSNVGAPPPLCGNDTVDPGEECDDGNTDSCDGCDFNCKLSACGNGAKCPPEECDDGNLSNGDGCDDHCRLELCGNGALDPGEDCDPPGSTTCPPGSPAPFLSCSPVCTCGPAPTTTTTTATTSSSSTSSTTTSTTLPPGPPEHVQCYELKSTRPTRPLVRAEDRFGTYQDTLRFPHRLCAPANKNGEGIADPTEHLLGYVFRPQAAGASGQTIVDQFGALQLDVVRPLFLMVPTAAAGVPIAPPPGDHFVCHKVKRTRRAPKFAKRTVTVEDRFSPGGAAVTLLQPALLCAPANKNGEDPAAPGHPYHLLCYTTQGPARVPTVSVRVDNQFGSREVLVTHRRELCVPALANPGA